VRVNEDEPAGEAQVIQLSREGSEITLRADAAATLLVLTGEPIDEPIAGYGPFVMNSREDIVQAIDDFNNGRFLGEPA
jgi:redox-sensitive bicupin YhaK (pirin superfamily)